MERPNTIFGLQAKRAELVKLHQQLVADAKKVVVDIDHLDATIRLFDPNADIQRVRLNRYAIKHKAHFGHTKRFLLNEFRTADRPLCSRDLCDAWIKDRGLQPDESTRVILRKRVGACISTLRHQGIIENAGVTDDADPNGPYKLWRLKQGG